MRRAGRAACIVDPDGTRTAHERHASAHPDGTHVVDVQDTTWPGLVHRYSKPIIIEEMGIAAARNNFQVMRDFCHDKYVSWRVDAIMRWGVE